MWLEHLLFGAGTRHDARGCFTRNGKAFEFCLQSFKVYGEHGRNGAQFIDNIERE